MGERAEDDEAEDEEGEDDLAEDDGSEDAEGEHVTLDLPAEVPTRLRSALRLRDPADVFPYGTCTTAAIDADHTRPYVLLSLGGPPGQTGLHNLAPLSRSHHRAVTFGRLATPPARTRPARPPLTDRLPVRRHQPRHPLPRQRPLRLRRLGRRRAAGARRLETSTRSR